MKDAAQHRGRGQTGTPNFVRHLPLKLKPVQPCCPVAGRPAPELQMAQCPMTARKLPVTANWGWLHSARPRRWPGLKLLALRSQHKPKPHSEAPTDEYYPGRVCLRSCILSSCQPFCQPRPKRISFTTSRYAYRWFEPSNLPSLASPSACKPGRCLSPCGFATDITYLHPHPLPRHKMATSVQVLKVRDAMLSIGAVWSFGRASLRIVR